jgi:hypothetical protein
MALINHKQDRLDCLSLELVTSRKRKNGSGSMEWIPYMWDEAILPGSTFHKGLTPILLAINSKRKRRAPYDPVFLTPAGSRPHEDSLKKPWQEALESLEFNPMPRIHDLRHCWKANAMRSGLHPLIADAIVGHGDRKKDVKSVYLTISDADLLREIDKLTFDHGKTEIWGQR